MGVCTWSHVEPFRRAEFKDKARDGAALEQGRRERDRLLFYECWWRGNYWEIVFEKDQDGGRKGPHCGTYKTHGVIFTVTKKRHIRLPQKPFALPRQPVNEQMLSASLGCRLDRTRWGPQWGGLVEPTMEELGPIEGNHCTSASLCCTKPLTNLAVLVDCKYWFGAACSRCRGGPVVKFTLLFVLSFLFYKWHINYFLYLGKFVVLWCLTCYNNVSQPLFYFGTVIPQCCCFKHNRKLASAAGQLLLTLSSLPCSMDESQRWIWPKLSRGGKIQVVLVCVLWYSRLLQATVLLFLIGSF